MPKGKTTGKKTTVTWVRLTWYASDGSVSDSGAYPLDYAFDTMIPYLREKGYEFIVTPMQAP